MQKMLPILTRPRLQRGLVARHSRKVIIPQPPQRRLGRLDPRGFYGKNLGQLLALGGGEGVVAADPAGAEEEDVAGLEAGCWVETLVDGDFLEESCWDGGCGEGG